MGFAAEHSPRGAEGVGMKSPRVQLEEALAQAHGLADGLTEERMNYRPAPGVWSVGENLGHLTITARRMMKAMDAAVDSLREGGRRSDGPYRPSLMGRWFLWLLEPPVRAVKFKAPAEFHGAPDRVAHLVRGEFFAAQEELLHRLSEYEAWDQNARLVVSPFDPSRKLRYSLGLSLRIIPTHMRRHLWQAQQVLPNTSRT
jgi:hypothetical protein